MRSIPLLWTLPALVLAACAETMTDVDPAVTGSVELQVTAGVSTRSTDSGWDADVIGIRTVSVSEGSTSTMVADYANVAYAT
ncbi:MAG: fimbrillin family protein, partial [Prevotellaceae bacterium]|nr:fimbrillin family protein [Prevotellaceae bacterium]